MNDEHATQTCANERKNTPDEIMYLPCIVRFTNMVRVLHGLRGRRQADVRHGRGRQLDARGLHQRDGRLLLAIAIPVVQGEHAAVAALLWTATAFSTLLPSCLVGIGVSHSAHVMRSACSATLSAVVGTLCKVLIVLINMCLWDKHASPV